MGHWARINENNIVQEVLVITKEELDKGTWGDTSKWIKTSYNTCDGKHYVPKQNQDYSEENSDQSKAIRYRFASIGDIYDATNDVFYKQSPFASWVLNKTNWEWEAPVTEPELTEQQKYDCCMHKWNEEAYQADNTKGWELFTPEKPEKEFASWTWEPSIFNWKAPIDMPDDAWKDDLPNIEYYWNEELYQSDNTKGWVAKDG